MSIYLKGLALQNYRGIGPDWQFMPRLKQFNFFVGPNNSGKSGPLNFISQYIKTSGSTPATEASPLEKYDGGSKGGTTFAVGLSVAEYREVCLEKWPFLANNGPSRWLDAVLVKISTDGIVWLERAIPGKAEFKFRSIDGNDLADVVDQQSWNVVWRNMTGQSGGGFLQHWLPETVRLLQGVVPTAFPKVNLIPAIREIGPKSEGFDDYSGKGLIDRLAEAQSPNWDRREDRILFDKINEFLQFVTNDATARIEIPHDRQQVLVHMGGRVLPISSLGTGIHEVVMIASFCTLSNDQIVCIEEPEIHLHPLLQRKLISYLGRATSNQYFIATHSAAFIDTPGAAIFHVNHDGAQTRIKETILSGDKYEICSDLGCRASDIVQANSVIWVEGPSDRIYARHWISSFDPELVEGIHYAIMFYGGRLLSHLDGNDSELSDFISLRYLNRNSAIIMDSDKASPQSHINGTKTRVAEAFGSGRGMAWITAGREIENYINPDTLHAALAAIYGDRYGSQVSVGRYDHAMHFNSAVTNRATASKVVTDVDKVRLAKQVCTSPADFETLDLKKQIAEMVRLIRDANR